MKPLQSLFLIANCLILANNNKTPELSPCPRVFTYEPDGPEPDRWYGILTLLSDNDLTGVWIRLIFDKPIIQLGNWFGEVVKRGPTDYLIRNPQYTLIARTPKIVRVYVKYDVNESPPKLMQFRLNGKVICPEIITTTTSTTTEHLFTSFEENPENSQVSFTEATTSEFNSGSNYAPTDNKNSYVVTESPYTQLLLPNRHTIILEISKKQLFKCCKIYSTTPLMQQSQNTDEICGKVQHNQRQERHGPQVAHKGEFPWHAMLYYSKDITIAYLCGAALISKLHILTVAHCVIKSQSRIPVNPERLIVYLGKYYVKHWQHESSQTRYVSDITPHPGYNSDTYDNDIALLKLLNPADFTKYVRPICLWRELTDFGSIANRAGTVAGWGFDETGRIEDKLMFVQMYVQENEVCNRSVANYESRFTSGKTFCANFIDDSIECVGDSGGALVFPGSGPSSSWQLRGLVTVSVVLQHQLKCGRDRFVVFTDVAKYHNWIEENTNSI